MVGGKVYFYIPNTTTLKDTYQDAAQTILNTNPVVLNAAGQATIWGTGPYRQIAYDPHGNLLWDRYITDTSYAAAQVATQVQENLDYFQADLAGPTGATLIGFQPSGTGEPATTLDARLKGYESDIDAGAISGRYRLIAKTGTGGEPNVIVNGGLQNQVAPHATAGHIQAGTAGLPNWIGFKFHWAEQPSDGGPTYSFTVPFEVPNAPWSVRVKSFVKTTNVFFPVGVASVTGYGTTNITITLTANLPIDRDIWVEFLSNVPQSPSDPDSNPRLAFILSGYNNVANQLMSVVNGAHMRVVGNDGHNTTLGGSNCLILGGAYHTLGGTNVISGKNDAAAIGVVGIGTNLRVDGRGACAFGNSNTIWGNGASVSGENNKVLAPAAAASGIGNTVSGNASFAHGNGNAITGINGLVFGLQNTVAAGYARVSGRNCAAPAGDYSDVHGQDNTSSHAWSSVRGMRGMTRNVAQHVMGQNGANQGDRQSSDVYVAGQSTTITQINLTKSMGATVNVAADAAIAVRGRILARAKNSDECAVFNVDALVMTVGSTSSIVGGATNTLIYSTGGASSWTTTLAASGGGFVVRAIGATDTVINWTADLKLTELSINAQ